MDPLLGCVANISEGRRAELLAELADACGASLLDLHADPDHHRSVFTLAGRGPKAREAALRLARAVAAHLDVGAHDGVHPRLGALDVVPFVALAGARPDDAREAARSFGRAAAEELAVPVFLYGGAHPTGRPLPAVRRGAFSSLAPDLGPSEPHPTLGAICVGARPLLVALNCELGGDDPDLARAIAKEVRERDGGLPGVQALGFRLASRGRAQVSMNLVDLAATGIEEAVACVIRVARREDTEVTGVELVGLVPAAELERCSPRFRSWTGLSENRTIEARLQAAGLMGD